MCNGYMLSQFPISSPYPFENDKRVGFGSFYCGRTLLFHEWVSVNHEYVNMSCEQVSVSNEWMNMGLKRHFQKNPSMLKGIFSNRFGWHGKICTDTTKYFSTSLTYPHGIPWFQIVTIKMAPMCVISHSIN